MRDDQAFGPLPPRSLMRDVVFKRLADDIATGRLSESETVRDTDLQAEFGVSRTPIREALIRLSDLGLIEVRSNKDTRVAAIDHDTQFERALAANAVVACAARLLSPSTPPGHRAELCARMDEVARSTGQDLLVRWYELYEAIVCLSGRSVLREIFRERLGIHLLRSAHTVQVPPAVIPILERHLRDLRGAVEAGDGAVAAECIVSAFDEAVRAACPTASVLQTR